MLKLFFLSNKKNMVAEDSEMKSQYYTEHVQILFNKWWNGDIFEDYYQCCANESRNEATPIPNTRWIIASCILKERDSFIVYTLVIVFRSFDKVTS